MFLYNFSSWIPKDLHAKFELPTQLKNGSKVCGGENGGSGGGKLCNPTLVISLSLSKAEQ